MEKLFYKDTHIIDFKGQVTECLETDGKYLVVLDRTAFFPEEGGQAADQGTLNGRKVLDVQIKNDIIYHLMDQPLEVGNPAQGHVDWAQRFDFMQQHTGEHIISGLVHEKYQYDNVGFHLSRNEVTLDFNGSLSMEHLREIETKANEIIWAGLPVKVWFPDAALLSGMSYRSKIELSDNIRIVEIPGVDVCACCAPHVDNTARIGILKITDVHSHRGGVRVYIVCGSRALKDYTRKQDSTSAISVLLSARADEVSDAVSRLMQDNRQLKERNNALQASLLKTEMNSLPSPADQKNVMLIVNSMDTIAIRNTVNELLSRYDGYSAVFSGDDTEGYRYVIGSRLHDCRELNKQLMGLGAKGGGSAPMVQGNIPASSAQIREFFASLG